jgi:hypothetical protein
MNSFSGLFKKENVGELILGILFIIYIIIGKRPPKVVANAVSSLFGIAVIFLIVVYMFMYTNPILAILGLFVAYDLIRRSGYVSNENKMQKYMPSEEKKSSQFTAFHQFPYTLEQEVVKKMAPIVQSGTTLTKPSYKPVLNNLYDASPVNSSN